MVDPRLLVAIGFYSRIDNYSAVTDFHKQVRNVRERFELRLGFIQFVWAGSRFRHYSRSMLTAYFFLFLHNVSFYCTVPSKRSNLFHLVGHAYLVFQDR